MKTAAALILIVTSSLAVPIEDKENWKVTKTFRDAPGGYYGLPSYEGAAGIASGSAVGAAGHGEMVGIFPNAKVGGCSVPLLLSCSPNIIHGKIVHGYSAPTYKNAKDEIMREADWMKQAREASHHKVPVGYPEPNYIAIVPVPHHETEQATKI